MEGIPNTPSKSRNWWKWGFFVVLFLLELAREVLVIQMAHTPTGPSLFIHSSDQHIHAEGMWVRTDKGQHILQNAVIIECRDDMGVCIESQTNLEEPVASPNISISSIKERTPYFVAYQIDDSICARYETRIDLQQKRAFSTRFNKAPHVANCKGLEHRIDLELVDGPLHGNMDMAKSESFLPLLRTLSFIAGN